LFRATVHSFDHHRQPEPPVSLAANAASAALTVSDVPWGGPIGCVRVALVDGTFVAEPTKQELEASTLDLLYAGTSERTLMIEVRTSVNLIVKLINSTTSPASIATSASVNLGISML
jgi:polyribonucleotide nucleotidyltransferase